MTKEDYNNKIIDDAVETLKNDGVIVIPTDTVYGFAIDSKSMMAMDKVYEIKKRNLEKKLPIIVDTYERLMSLCEITKDELKRLHSFYPGKLTLVLKKKNIDDTVAVRMINNEIINKIISRLDSPLMLTSANISGKKTSDDIMDILEEFDGKIDMAIIGNKLSSVSSTIVELIDGKLTLIREGAIPFTEIETTFYRR
jgi:L-threonylcarbamoyladenylate synthase